MALGTQEDTGLAEREKLVQSRWHGRRSSESAPRPEKISSASPRDSFAFRDHSFCCSLTTTAVITAACTKMATARAVADQAGVRRERFHRNSEMRLPRSNHRRWRGACTSTASIAANSLSPARADGGRSVSLGGSSPQAPRGSYQFAAPVRGRRPALAPRDWRQGLSFRPHATAAELLSPDAPALCFPLSWPTSFNSLRLKQLR
jgi:hypothetical protein